MWTVEFAAAAERDFELIFDHLLQSYLDFGDDAQTAMERAEQRILAIQASALDLAKTPFQGTLRPDILEELRYVRRDRAVFWFIANKERKVVQVLAVFFGGQNHIQRMLTRLLSDAPEQSIARRGDLRFWIDEAVIRDWATARRRPPGGQRRYSEPAITATLTLSAVYRLPPRQSNELM